MLMSAIATTATISRYASLKNIMFPPSFCHLICLNQLLDLTWQEKNPRFRESGDSDDDEEDDRKRRG